MLINYPVKRWAYFLFALLFTTTVWAQVPNEKISESERQTLIHEILSSNVDAYQGFNTSEDISDEILMNYKISKSNSNASFSGASTSCNTSITTTFNDNNSFNGNYFDVSAQNTVTVHDLFVNTDPGTHTIEVWTRTGTHVGFESSSNGWTLHKTVTITGGSNVSIGGGLSIIISAGQTVGFYVFINDTFGAMPYTNGTALGNVYVSNSDLTVYEGSGATNIRFSSSLFTPRVWNGTICYTLGSGCSNPVSVDINTYGLKPFWGLPDPNTFYWGINQKKRLRAVKSGGVGPYSYNWTIQGPGTFNQPHAGGAGIYLFEPTGPVRVYVEVTDAGTGCTAMDSVDIAWDDQYFCGTFTPRTWYLTICEDGITSCVPWKTAITAIKGGLATIGSCNIPTKTEAPAISASLYPNPTNGSATLEYQAEKAGPGSLVVMDINGRIIQQAEVRVNTGVQYQNIDLSDVPNGLYFVRLSTDHDVFTEKLQVIK